MVSVFLAPALLALASYAGSPASSPAASFVPEQTGVTTTQPRSAVCYKMRTYIFERHDDAAPKLIRETTCSPVRPILKRSQMPKARIVPAN